MTIRLSRTAGRLLLLLALGGLLTIALGIIDLTVATRADVTARGEPIFVGLRQGERFASGGSVHVRVRGSGPLATALRAELPSALTAEAAYHDAVVTDAITERLAVAVLDVRLARVAGFWTPVLARSHVVLEAAYASDGDPSWLEQAEGVVEASADPVARVRLRVDGRFGATGLVFRRGFYRAVAESLARSLARELATQLERG